MSPGPECTRFQARPLRAYMYLIWEILGDDESDWQKATDIIAVLLMLSAVGYIGYDTIRGGRGGGGPVDVVGGGGGDGGGGPGDGVVRAGGGRGGGGGGPIDGVRGVGGGRGGGEGGLGDGVGGAGGGGGGGGRGGPGDGDGDGVGGAAVGEEDGGVYDAGRSGLLVLLVDSTTRRCILHGCSAHHATRAPGRRHEWTNRSESYLFGASLLPAATLDCASSSTPPTSSRLNSLSASNILISCTPWRARNGRSIIGPHQSAAYLLGTSLLPTSPRLQALRHPMLLDDVEQTNWVPVVARDEEAADRVPAMARTNKMACLLGTSLLPTAPRLHAPHHLVLLDDKEEADWVPAVARDEEEANCLPWRAPRWPTCSAPRSSPPPRASMLYATRCCSTTRRPAGCLPSLALSPTSCTAASSSTPCSRSSHRRSRAFL